MNQLDYHMVSVSTNALSMTNLSILIMKINEKLRFLFILMNHDRNGKDRDENQSKQGRAESRIA